ncbi:CDP-glycerol glycerophosphotransferase family protein [Cetobacterium sp. 2G large]|uniref:CDP-glycerol glycerophosphotransferase family protein n=1 Tax=Cetobacterium sp. 2G large TaxID=2759680 RepID=UPI00163BF019|nr:CDP-glycerol glycerophosphotransferase family protein [Cetobacterium sp. 2G large]
MRKILIQLLAILLSLFIRKKEEKLIVLYFDGEKFLFNTRIFFKYLINVSKYDVKYIINDRKKREDLEKKYGKKFLSMDNLKEIKKILKAKAWLVDGGFPIKTPFNHKDRVLINFWHGSPIKHIGLDGYSGINKMRVWLQLKMFSSRYNGFFIISPRVKEIFKKTFLLEEDKIKLLGQPRNDLLFKKNDRKIILEKLYLNLPEYKKVILYAPTYRGNYGGKIIETKYFPFEDFDKENFELFLKENKILFLVRNHHLDRIKFDETEQIKLLGNEKVEDISEILNIFDILISDYSGMVFDYLQLKKPMLFLPYDLKEYEKNTGIYFNYEKVSPGPKPKNYFEFKNEINKLLNNKKYYLKERREMENYFNQIGDGNCKRAFDFLEKELKK